MYNVNKVNNVSNVNNVNNVISGIVEPPPFEIPETQVEPKPATKKDTGTAGKAMAASKEFHHKLTDNPILREFELWRGVICELAQMDGGFDKVTKVLKWAEFKYDGEISKWEPKYFAKDQWNKIYNAYKKKGKL